jgi:ABC-type Fe3+/spermidine/putrescine transport system ATPase subunit
MASAAIAADKGALQAAHLRLDAVVKRFEAMTAVDHVTLAIPPGAFATLLGPSGCGKATLLRLTAGFYEPQGGAIYLDHARIDQLPAHRRGTAMVFQAYALFPHMRVYDNVAYGLRLAGLPKGQIAQRVAETLQFVDLSGVVERWPHQLSGGQQQVALVRALVVRPKVLLLDEPLSNLDASLRERIRWELRALQQRLNLDRRMSAAGFPRAPDALLGTESSGLQCRGCREWSSLSFSSQKRPGLCRYVCR